MATIKFGTSLDSLGIPNVQNTLHNYTAVTAPTSNDDAGDGYSVGSFWIDTATDIVYVCADSTVGAAVWQVSTPESGGANTGSNVNVSGVGVFKQKTGLNLEFRGVHAASPKITVTLDNLNNEIDIDLGTVTLDDLSNVATAGQARGNSLVFDGTNWVVGFSPFVIECSRNATNTTNVWLRGTDGLPHNESPILIPFDAKLVAVAATTNGAETWDAEVYTTTDVRAGGTPTDANKIAELAVVASQSSSNTYNVDIASGTEIGVFCRGTSIDRPRVMLFLVRRQ